MLVTMSNKELHRLPVIQAVVEKRLRRRDAASQLDLTERQVQRLMNRFRESGASVRTPHLETVELRNHGLVVAARACEKLLLLIEKTNRDSPRTSPNPSISCRYSLPKFTVPVRF